MFLGLLDPDPDPDPLGKGIDLDPAPPLSKNSKKTSIFTVLGLLFDFLSLKNYVKVPSKSNMQKKKRN